MRKIVLLFLAAVFMTVPVMAVSNVSITCVQGTGADINSVTVSYASDHNLIRAFGLDITAVGANITRVVPVDANYRIYPGQIVIADGNVTSYGTCYDPCDLGDGSVTVEMGSLYTTDPCYAGDANAGYGMKPHLTGTLLKFYVSASCTYAVTKNVARGGVVMENPAEDPNVTLCSGSVVLCPPAPGAANTPTPSAGAKCVPLAQVLSWTPGSDTATQDVYFGTTNPPPYVTTVPVGTTTYDPPGDMAVYTLYYWRIDELNVCGVKTTGTVWCFATGPQAGKACCSNDPNCTNAPNCCLGNINTDTRVTTTDYGLLVTFLAGLPNNRCNTAVGSTTCPPCYDINGSGRVDTTDLGVLATKLANWANNRHNCPYPSCSNP
jgi:hypothetical protein